MTLSAVRRQAIFVRTVYGLTLGLYLFTYPLTLLDGFAQSPFTNRPELSFATLFVFGILLEALLELPLGAYGDIRGYRRTLTLSFLFRGIYFLGLALIAYYSAHVSAWPSLLAFPTIAVFSVSFTLWSGSSSAWLYELTVACDAESDYDRILSRILMYYYVGFAAGAVLGALLYFSGHQILQYVIGATLCLLVAAYGHEHLLEPRPGSKGAYRRQLANVIARAIRYCIRTNAIFYLLQLSAFFTLLMYVIDFLWPPYAKDTLGITAENFGQTWPQWYAIILIMIFGGTLGNFAIVYLTRAAGETTARGLWNRVILSSFLFGFPIAALSILALNGVNSPALFIALVALSQLALGAREAPFDTLLNRAISKATARNGKERAGEVRATVISAATIFNAVTVLVFFIPTTVFSIAAGVNADELNMVQGWFIPALLLIAVAALTAKRVR